MPRDAAAFLEYIGDPLAPLAVGAGARKELKIWLLREVPELRFYDSPAAMQKRIGDALAIGRSQRVVDGLIDMLTLYAAAAAAGADPNAVRTAAKRTGPAGAWRPQQRCECRQTAGSRE